MKSVVNNVAYVNCHLTLSDDPERNLALGKPTAQIDVYDFLNNKGYWHNGSSHNGVDGNFQTDPQNKTCFRTRKRQLNWWMVDLEDYYLISDIVVMIIDFGTIIFTYRSLETLF